MKKFNPEIWLSERRNFNVAEWLRPEVSRNSSRNSSRKSELKQAETNGSQKFQQKFSQNLMYEVDVIISRIEEQKIDLTENRAEWVKLAFIFSASFAESGRKFFHRVSRFYSGYCPAECDKLYDDCMKRKKYENIQAFFLMARNAGVDIWVK